MSSTRGRLICFSGVDGAGKTTLARHLAVSLTSAEVRYRYVYARFLPILVRPIWALSRSLFLRGSDIESDFAEYQTNKRGWLQMSWLRKLYQYSILVDYFFQVLYRVTIPLKLGANLVCDRYVHDTVISDLAPDLDFTHDQARQMIKDCFRIMPRPDLVFLVDVPENHSMARKTDIPSAQYLIERRRMYSAVTSVMEVVSLDGKRPLDQLRDEVVKIAEDRFQ
jgi:thymidylate kinase